MVDTISFIFYTGYYTTEEASKMNINMIMSIIMENILLIIIVGAVVIIMLCVCLLIINNLKRKNATLNSIITNHKNNIPTILKIRKDNSDLLFFYRELIHTFAYYNPILERVSDFIDNIINSKIKFDNKEINNKEYATKFGELLAELDFSDIDNQMDKFKNSMMEILTCPFYEFGKEYPSIHDEKHCELFRQNIFNNMLDILKLREDDIVNINKLYQRLITDNERWRDIKSRTAIGHVFNFIEDLLGNVAKETVFRAFKPLIEWAESDTVSDKEFVERYDNTVNLFISTSSNFSQNMDKEFTKLEILYQEYQEIENSLLHEKIQTLLTSGYDISEIYSKWRTAQANKALVLDDFPDITNLVFKNLKEKKLNEDSLNNIKSIIGVQNKSPQTNFD